MPSRDQNEDPGDYPLPIRWLGGHKALMSDDTGTLISEAERRIQIILIELEEDIGCRIEQVSVDTRNFANLSVDIVINKGV